MALIVKRSWPELANREKSRFSILSATMSELALSFGPVYPKLPDSGPDNELKSTLDTAPHPQETPLGASSHLDFSYQYHGPTISL